MVTLIARITALSLLTTLCTTAALAQSMDKKTQDVTASRVIPHPAEAIWEVIAADYGRVAESHPKIVSSDYLHDSLEGGLDVERSCWFNDKGTQTLHEQITSWDPEHYTFTNRILEVQGFPIDIDNTEATYRVEDLGDGTSRVVMDMAFRAKPAMMTGMMKGPFKSLLNDYLIAVEHNLSTGEKVTRDNFKDIATLYR